VNWKDLEFIRDLPPEAKEEIVPAELTGWETIIFELTDEQDEE
jgi:hypothetical protein